MTDRHQHKEEYRLFELINKYDRKLVAVCLESTILGMQRMDESLRFKNYVQVPMPGIIDDCCYRIHFQFPLLILISQQIAYFRMLLKYYKSSMGFMPVYVPSLNEITLLKTWDRFADSTLGPTSRFDKDYACVRISTVHTPAELSSMNFILRNHTEFEEENDAALVSLLVKYFQYFYWTVPQPGKYMNTMFYHDFQEIHHTYQVTKTIFIVDRIKFGEEIVIGNKNIRVHRASVRKFVYAAGQYKLQQVDCYVTDEIVQAIKYESLHVIIGLLSTVRVDNMIHNILVGPICAISETVELVQAITGLIATERFDLTGQLSIGRTSEFEKEVYRTILIFDEFELLDNIRDYHRGLFNEAINRLSPALLIDQTEEVYFLHPVFMGILAYLDRFDLVTKSTLLLNLIKISRYNRREARLSTEADNLQKEGLRKNVMLDCITMINDAFSYSRILKR